MDEKLATPRRAAWVSDALWARIQRGRRLLAQEVQMSASMRRDEVDRRFTTVWTGTLEREGQCPHISSYAGGSQLSPVAIERYHLGGGDPLSPAHKLKKRKGAE